MVSELNIYVALGIAFWSLTFSIRLAIALFETK